MEKRFLTTFLLVSVTVATMFAQQDSTQSWKMTMARHDVQVGIGDPFVAGWMTGNKFLFLSDMTPLEEEANAPDMWFKKDVFKGYSFTTGALSVAYRYRVAKWLWVGGTVGYVGFHTAYIDRLTHEKAGTDHTDLVMVMPSVRFSWLNKKYVTLYSGLSAGYAISIVKSFNDLDGGASLTLRHHFAGQLTAVGVHVGTKWYGFTEVGFGLQGIVSAGFGCHIGAPKK